MALCCMWGYVVCGVMLYVHVGLWLWLGLGLAHRNHPHLALALALALALTRADDECKHEDSDGRDEHLVVCLHRYIWVRL